MARAEDSARATVSCLDMDRSEADFIGFNLSCIGDERAFSYVSSRARVTSLTLSSNAAATNVSIAARG